MIYLLFKYLERFGFPWLFRYISTRSAAAFTSSLASILLLGRPVINGLYRRGFRSVERSYGDISTHSKRGTPIMGGVLLLLCGLGGAVLWCDLSNPFVIQLLCSGVYFAALGAMDDIKKVRGKTADSGLSRAAKYIAQIAFGLATGVVVSSPGLSPLPADQATQLYLPFFKHPVWDLGWLYLPFAVVMIIYSANAVNFADGMDGLVVVPSIMVTGVLGVFAYVVGSMVYSQYLLYPFFPRAAEVTVFASALGGTCLGFLWFNSYPAEVFMGDTGSLFLGGVMGTAALLLKQEAVFVLAGGVFFVEILSTFVQETFGLKRGRRIFARAPLHHTFQHQQMTESKIVIRFWIVSVLLAVVALATIKAR